MCLLVWSSETKTLVFFCSPFDSFNVAKILIAELKHTRFRVWSIAINRRKVDFGIRCDSSSNLRRNEHIALSSILWATSRKEEEETFHSSSYQLYKIVLCEQKKTHFVVSQRQIQARLLLTCRQWLVVVVVLVVCCGFCWCFASFLSSFKLPLKLSVRSGTHFQVGGFHAWKHASRNFSGCHLDFLCGLGALLFVSHSHSLPTSNLEVMIKAAILPRYKSKLFPIHYGNSMAWKSVEYGQLCARLFRGDTQYFDLHWDLTQISSILLYLQMVLVDP